MENKKVKDVFLLLGILGIGVFLFFFFYKDLQREASFSSAELLLAEEERFNESASFQDEKKKTHTILFTGDIMLDRGVKMMTEKHGEGDYTFPFLNISKKLQSADILFGNLESMISDKGRDMGSLYSFRADPGALDGLVFAGFDVVSLANNHTFDYGREAFEDTMERLEEAGISYTGAGFDKEEAHSPTILLLDEDTRVGFLGYTEFLYPHARATKETSGTTTFSKENMEEDINTAKEETDFLVVTFHYGDEYQKKPNERQKLLSRKAIDYGADIVIGHHPHVTQPVEEYEGKYIAYSLGNFIFDQYFSEETMRGFMLEVELTENEITKINKVHYELNEFYQPKVTKEEVVRK